MLHEVFDHAAVRMAERTLKSAYIGRWVRHRQFRQPRSVQEFRKGGSDLFGGRKNQIPLKGHCRDAAFPQTALRNRSFPYSRLHFCIARAEKYFARHSPAKNNRRHKIITRLPTQRQINVFNATTGNSSASRRSIASTKGPRGKSRPIRRPRCF